MAKLTESFSGKGVLSLDEMTIYEIKKDNITKVNFLEVLKKFDNKEVTISINYQEDFKVVKDDEEFDDNESSEDEDS